MQSLAELIRDLLDHYQETDERGRPIGPRGPALLTRLDTISLRTGQPAEVGGHAPPGSRPPASLDAVHWSVRIKAEAVVLDLELRGSWQRQTWERAMRGIPYNAQAVGRERDVTSTVGAWHGTALTVLGLRRPSMHFQFVRCLVCGERTVYGRADDDRPRAWCINDDCVDGETGRPARYEGVRLHLLTTNTTDLGAST